MRTLVILLAFLTTAAIADADAHCPTSDPEVTLETPAGTFYVDNDMCQPHCLFSVWVYQESNGQPGLQRCEDWIEACYGCEPDTIIL